MKSVLRKPNTGTNENGNSNQQKLLTIEQVYFQLQLAFDNLKASTINIIMQQNNEINELKNKLNTLEESKNVKG